MTSAHESTLKMFLEVREFDICCYPSDVSCQLSGGAVIIGQTYNNNVMAFDSLTVICKKSHIPKTSQYMAP
jgi:hypothetical protein